MEEAEEEVVVEEGVEGNNKAACMEVTPGFNSAKKKKKKILTSFQGTNWDNDIYIFFSLSLINRICRPPGYGR